MLITSLKLMSLSKQKSPSIGKGFRVIVICLFSQLMWANSSVSVAQKGQYLNPKSFQPSPTFSQMLR